MLRYAITDRRMFAGDEAARRAGLLGQARRLAADGVDFLQVREKDLPREELLALLQELRAVLPRSGGTRILVNAGGRLSPVEIARVVRKGLADGVHLPGGWTRAALQHWRKSTADQKSAGADARPSRPLVLSVACHRVEEVRAAAQDGADLILFSPVFGKRVDGDAVIAGTGLSTLREAVAAAGATRLLALGGVTLANARSCVEAGAPGIAGIRIFAGV